MLLKFGGPGAILNNAADQREALAGLLIAVAERQDRDAFAELYRHFAPKLKTLCTRMGVTAGAADEIVQEILLTVWRRAATFDSSRAAVSTWVYTIARNRVIDHKRKGQRAEIDLNDPALVTAEVPDHETRIDAERRAVRLRAAIADLPPDQAEVVRIAYFQAKTQGEIAEQQGLPLGTVKSRTRLALARLRAALAGGQEQP